MNFGILGPLEVDAGSGPVSVGGAKPRALLAVLLLRANAVVSNDHLIDALWGGRPPDTALKALQVHVSQLRKVIGSQAIRTQSPGYVLDVDTNELDLHRFEHLHEKARPLLASDPAHAKRLLDEALALWRGPALAEFSYEPFAQREIARLDDLRIAAHEDRIEADLALGHHTEVIGELEGLIAEYPLRERPRAQHMTALYRSGRQAEALDAYQAARAALTEELGIEPGRELRDLQAAILRQDPALDHDMPEAPDPPPRPKDGLVGRGTELTELGLALDAAFAGRGGVVLLAGEPGIGKSRLADELVREAVARGARVLVGRCWEAGGAPAFWPWVQAFRAYTREAGAEVVRAQLGREAADLGAILPELRDGSAAPELDTGGSRFQLLDSTAAVLKRIAESSPLVVVLDDLHAADDASLLLLRFVASQVASCSILIVGSYRDTEVGAPLAETLAELTREPNVRRLALKGLSADDTARLLASAVGDGPAAEVAADVYAETLGNPLFALEIGRLIGSEDYDHGQLPIPDSVRETISQRLERESSGCREVLALASVMGREFDPDVLARLSALDEDGLYERLDEAAAARLVDGVPEASGRLRFAHMLIRDVLYEGLPAPRRLRMHRKIGETLEEVFAAHLDPHLAEIAHHYMRAGTVAAPKAIDYAQRAGDRAAQQHAYEEAARHYKSAMSVLETTGSATPGVTCELMLSLGEVQSRSGDGHEARQSLQRAAALAEQTGRSDQLARAALDYGGRFAWARASSDPGLVPLLERALAAVGDDDPLTRVKLLARLAGAVRDEPRRERRTALGTEALEIAHRAGDPRTLAFALEGYWVAVEGPDEIGGGISVGQRLIDLGEQIGDRERVFAGHDHRVHLFWQLADRAGVDVELDALMTLAAELRQPAQHWHGGTCQTMLALMEGRFDDAERLIATTRALGERAQSWNAVVSERIALFVLRREQGRLAELEDTLKRSVHEYPALLRFRTALVHLYSELGRQADARAGLEAVMALDLANEYRDAEWLFTVCVLVDPCVHVGDAAAAQKLYSLLLPYERLYAVAPVEATFGSVARGLGVLATKLARFDDAERHLELAIETERQMGARPWLELAEHDKGLLQLARGEEAGSERWDPEATRLGWTGRPSPPPSV